ncbi:MAG: hypothetical protein ACLFNU_06875 [Bacteroidales bacterium]
MKRLVIIILVTAVFFSCKEKEKQEIKRLTQEVETLKAESHAKDSAITNFFRILNDIDSNLSLIMQKEQVIAKNAALGNEMQQDVRERIQQDINTINELMNKNNSAISKLQSQLKGANLQIGEFENRIKSAQNLIEKRNAEVEDLKGRLETLDFSLEQLNATLDTLSLEKEMLEEQVDKQKTDLYTAWYAFGSKNELIDNGVVEKVGGFLGIGKSLKLKADLNNSYFTKINIKETQSIPLFTTEATLITTHPNNSYELVVNENDVVEEIYIFNPELFWSTSKYLVILVK